VVYLGQAVATERKGDTGQLKRMYCPEIELSQDDTPKVRSPPASSPRRGTR